MSLAPVRKEPDPSSTPVEAITGWAVIDGGVICVRSVADTRRGAIVNWLWIQGVLIDNAMTDLDIEKLWQKHRDDAEARIISVSV